MMKYRNKILVGTLVCICFFKYSATALAQHQPSYKPNKKLLQIIGKSFVNASTQYQLLKANTPDSLFPRTFDSVKNKVVTSKSGWWCSGFYPGTLLYLYEQTKDTVLYNEAIRKLTYLAKEQYNTYTHDLGFMMYCSFGNANHLRPSAEYKSILLNSAKSLSSRFNPTVGCIKSWDSKPNDFLVIIDNMMNLELLFWATKNTGDSSFYKIAVAHANTTIKNHFREDYSSFHVVNYNPTTGTVKVKRTAQGAADFSAWARGQAWGLYGYTTMFRETKDQQYLNQAKHIAAFIINHRNLPKDKIPYWDFNAPDMPNTYRDASAAAVMASALIELSNYVSKPLAKQYMDVAGQMLGSLSSKKYTAEIGHNGGFILMHSTGDKPKNSEVDMPLSYADYYYVEALFRYRNQFVKVK